MFKLSVWSKKNPRTAIFIIAVCHLILLALSIIAGFGLAAQGYSFAAWITPVIVTIFGVVYFTYPDVSVNYFFHPAVYYRQKAADFLLVILQNTVVILGVAGIASLNPVASTNEIPVADAAVILEKSPQSSNSIASWDEKVSRWAMAQKQSLIKAFQNAVIYTRSITASFDEDKNKEKYRALMILTIFLIVLLSSGIAVLSCAISCSGKEGLAMIILFGGALGLGLGSAAVIRSIKRKYKPSAPAQ